MADWQRLNLEKSLWRQYNKANQVAFRETYKYFNYFRKASAEDMGGEFLQSVIQVSQNPTGHAGGEAGLFPDGGTSEEINLRLAPTLYRNSAAVSDRAVRDTRSGRHALMNALEKAQKQGREGIQRQMTYDLYAGRFGARAIVSAHSGANDGVLTLRKYDSVGSDFTSTFMDLVGTRWLIAGTTKNAPGMLVEIYSPTGTKRAENGGESVFWVYSKTNTSTCTVYCAIDGAVADFSAGGNRPAAGDLIVPAGHFNYGTPSVNDPIGYGTFGLMDIIGSSTYTWARLWQNYGSDSGLNRALYPILASTYINAGALALTSTHLENALDQIGDRYERIDEGNRGLILTDRATINVIKQWGSAQVYFQPQTAPLGMPADELSYAHGEQPLMFEHDPKCPPSCIFMINQNEMVEYPVEEISIVDEGGGPLRMQTVTNATAGNANQYKDQLTMLFRSVWQRFSQAPQAHGIICNYSGVDPEHGGGTGFLPIR